MKIAIVGWRTHTGLGYVNRDLWQTGLFDRWVIVKHPQLGVDDGMVANDPSRMPVAPFDGSFDKYLDGVDAVVVAEHTYRVRKDLFDLCRERRIATVLIPMMEWFPDVGTEDWKRWGAHPDAVYAPTRYSLGELHKIAATAIAARSVCRWSNGIVGGRWGVDLSEAARVRRVRTTAERFLFCNGWGGAHGRKGLEAFAAVSRSLPRVNFILRSQARVSGVRLGSNVDVIEGDASDRFSNFTEGDVLLAPSRFEGLGLQLYESQACGMPVLTTNAPPMNEAGPVKLIAAEKAIVMINGRRVDAWNVDKRHFGKMIGELHQAPIELGSRAAIDYIAANHNMTDVAADIVATARNCLDAIRRGK